MPEPIPINVRSRAGHMAGTAFVVTDGKSSWLTTCVHHVTNMINTPANQAHFGGATIAVLGVDLEIDLHDQFGEPRFNVVKNEATGNLIDALAVKLHAIEAKKLAPFGAYDLSETALPAVGQAVTVHGFPGLETAPMASSAMAATVDQIVGISARLDQPSALGFSGGPITAGGSILGVIRGDVGTPDNLKNGIGIIFAGQLMGKLFR